MKSIDPAAEGIIETYEEHDKAMVDARLNVTWDRFESWHETSISRREKLLVAAAGMLREHSEGYATLMTEEMDGPVEQTVSKVEKYIWVYNYYAEHASEFLRDEHTDTVLRSKTYASYEPVGPAPAVVPWNFPLWQVFRFAAPHITAGSVTVLKHVPNVFGCADAVTSVFEQAGYFDDMFTSLWTPAERVAGAIEDDRVRGVSLTGNTRAGWAVAETSGRELKPTAFELSGNDPSVVLNDVPLEAVAKWVAWTRTQNNGQSCTAAKRFLVHGVVHGEFVERFTEEMRIPAVGDPTNPETDVGSQARADLMETLHEQVTAFVEAGVMLRLGGESLDRPGHYYLPMVLTDAPKDAPTRAEELFSPVATVIRVENETEAVHVVNDTSYSLGASVWTAGAECGGVLTTKLTVDNVAVNHVITSDPRVPFGEAKDPGYGTELSRYRIREFINTKTVQVEDAPANEWTRRCLIQYPERYPTRHQV